MADPRTMAAERGSSAIEVNKVLRNTYALLAMTLLFSAVTATVAMATNMPHLGLLGLVAVFGLSFAIAKTANSVWGLVWTFALTGFLGLWIGPVVNFYLQTAHGTAVVAQALSITGIAFLGLSAFSVMSKADFSFLRGFMIIGFFVVIGGIIFSLFWPTTIMMQLIASVVVLLGGAYILYETSAVARGEQTNYVLATVGIFMGIYNIFSGLLMLLGMGGDD